MFSAAVGRLVVRVPYTPAPGDAGIVVDAFEYLLLPLKPLGSQVLFFWVARERWGDRFPCSLISRASFSLAPHELFFPSLSSLAGQGWKT